MPDITSVTVCFGHGIKREEYGPVKKAEVSITASVADGEAGEDILASVSHMALARVAAMLDAPKPVVANDSQDDLERTAGEQSGEAPPRRTRGANKSKTEGASSAKTPASAPTEASAEVAKPTEPAAVEDEWAAGAADIEITDQELLTATSKRAGELGARDPIIKLIATFATRIEGTPFKVQEIPQNQRKDYLTKLAALTA